MYGLLEITPEEFSNISRLVYTRFGINLTEKKITLVKGRLNKIIKTKGYSSFQEYYDAVLADTSGRELLELVDRISTNHTYFYREGDHFSVLRTRILPEMLEKGRLRDLSDLRLWCAGCASGEEAYTLAMELKEFARERMQHPARTILATDISLTALENAQRGEYPAERLRELSEEKRNRYFHLAENGTYRVKDELRSLILYKRLNLMSENYPFKNKFHIIFCRNVMIYFDKPTKDHLVQRMTDLLIPGGYLFIGHSESLGRDLKELRYRQPALYQKVAD